MGWPRLERWRVAPGFIKPRIQRESTDVIVVGQIYDGAVRWPRLPDGTFFEVAVEAEPVAVEGAMVRLAEVNMEHSLTLGVPAPYDFLADELYKVQVEVDKLKDKLRVRVDREQSEPLAWLAAPMHCCLRRARRRRGRRSCRWTTRTRSPATRDPKVMTAVAS